MSRKTKAELHEPHERLAAVDEVAAAFITAIIRAEHALEQYGYNMAISRAREAAKAAWDILSDEHEKIYGILSDDS